MALLFVSVIYFLYLCTRKPRWREMSLLIYKALKNDSIKAEREKLEKQHQWEIKAEDRRRYYKYQDQLLQLKEEKAIKIQLLETLTTEIQEKLS